jgi:hypothetical protein
MIYLVYNSTNGEFQGWYDDSIHASIPVPHVKVTADKYAELYQAQVDGKILSVSKGKAVLSDPVPLPLTWDDIRKIRNKLLSDTDWSQLSDVPAETTAKYIPYRTELRNIPETFSTPNKVVWPDLPA